jgi:hypothetical protein
MERSSAREKVARLQTLAAELASALESDVDQVVTGENQGSGASMRRKTCDSGFYCGKYNCTPPFSCSDYKCTSQFTLGFTTQVAQATE